MHKTLHRKHQTKVFLQKIVKYIKQTQLKCSLYSEFRGLQYVTNVVRVLPMICLQYKHIIRELRLDLDLCGHLCWSSVGKCNSLTRWFGTGTWPEYKNEQKILKTWEIAEIWQSVDAIGGFWSWSRTKGNGILVLGIWSDFWLKLNQREKQTGSVIRTRANKL